MANDPDLLTCLMEMCLVPHLSCRPSSNVPRLPSFFKVLQNPHVWFTVAEGAEIHCACHEKLRSNVQKCPKHGVFLAFWLRNVLAAAACTFWMLIPPDGSAPPRFSVLTFSTLRNRKTLEKHSVSRLSTSLAHLSLLSTFLFSDSTLYCCCICL